MEYRPLGNTGLDVSVLGLGASPFGGVFGTVDESAAVRTLHQSLDLGINLIDVSPYYGLTRAETVLGKALYGIGRDRYILATKVGRYGDAEFDFSAERVVASVDESLGRLGVDHIDLIQCHDIEFGDLDQIVNETVPALRGLVESGKVRFVGVTGYPLTALNYVTSRIPVDTVLTYCRYNLQDQSLLDWLPTFASQGVGVINASVLSMGMLTVRGAPSWHPAPPELQRVCAEAAALCTSRGSDISQLALQFAIAQPAVASTLIGSANPANMERNVALVGTPIDEQLLADVLAVLAPVHNQFWPNGRPENGDPVGA